ncbi:MAG: type III pantothenate kinase [Planctomycetaceae bacterium]
MNTFASSPLLAVDVGNSRVKFGLFAADVTANEPLQLPTIRNSLAIAPDAEVPWPIIREWSASNATGSPAGIVAGANPPIRDEITANWPADLPPPRVLTDPTELGISVQLEHPDRAGIDRLLNAVAVNCLRPDGRPAIIVDSGTATTVDALDAGGAFLGGAILPGFDLLARSLHRYTALLPLLSLEQLGDSPPSPLGKDTPAAIRSGLFYGQLGAVRELADSLERELGSGPATMFLTGGGGPLLATALPEARLVPHLGLLGLARIACEETGS